MGTITVILVTLTPLCDRNSILARSQISGYLNHQLYSVKSRPFCKKSVKIKLSGSD